MDWSEALFDLKHTRAEAILRKAHYPWEILPLLWDYMLQMKLPETEYEQTAPGVWIARDAAVDANVSITGPCVIGHETQVRFGAYLRGGVWTGDRCVVGHDTEMKNCLLFDGVKAPHFNYVGDSILGYEAHLGAGAVMSNVKSDKTQVTVRALGETVETGLRKFGGLLGDFAEVGCNSVLNPGTIVGRRAIVYPTSCVRGWVPEGHIYKDQAHIVERTEKLGG